MAAFISFHESYVGHRNILRTQFLDMKLKPEDNTHVTVVAGVCGLSSCVHRNECCSAPSACVCMDLSRSCRKFEIVRFLLGVSST